MGPGRADRTDRSTRAESSDPPRGSASPHPADTPRFPRDAARPRFAHQYRVRVGRSRSVDQQTFAKLELFVRDYGPAWPYRRISPFAPEGPSFPATSWHGAALLQP